LQPPETARSKGTGSLAKYKAECSAENTGRYMVKPPREMKERDRLQLDIVAHPVY
jgi:hypothetical protein